MAKVDLMEVIHARGCGALENVNGIYTRCIYKPFNGCDGRYTTRKLARKMRKQKSEAYTYTYRRNKQAIITPKVCERLGETV